VSVRTWDATSQKRLQGVHPDLIRGMARALQAAPFPFRVIDGLRTIERQKELVRIGASKTMNSRHLPGRGGLSHAVDIVPLVDLDRDGRLETEELFNWPLIRKLAPVVKAAFKAEGVPIEWGGDWKSFPDGPHWQLPWKAYPK
jgi:peptidoglycan LD-endopeptidase CwlK